MDIKKVKKGFKIDNKFGHKYQINENCFDIIDNELKAYCLGFLYADGNLGIYNNDYVIRLNLNAKDSEILDIFIKCFNTDRKWKTDKRGNIYLNIFNKKICFSLMKKGIVQAKTFKIKFPNNQIIPENFMSHFIRGYFDGDGTISLSKKYWNGSHVGIISNYDFIVGLKDYLVRFGFSNRKITKVWSKKYKTKKCGIFSLCGYRNIKRFYDYIYRDSHFFLKRKKVKFLEYFYERDKNIKTGWNRLYKFELVSSDNIYYKFHSLKDLITETGMCKHSYYKLVKNKAKFCKGWRLPDNFS